MTSLLGKNINQKLAILTVPFIFWYALSYSNDAITYAFKSQKLKDYQSEQLLLYLKRNDTARLTELLSQKYNVTPSIIERIIVNYRKRTFLDMATFVEFQEQEYNNPYHLTGFYFFFDKKLELISKKYKIPRQKMNNILDDIASFNASKDY